LHCAYSDENRLLKKTENSKIKTAKRIQNVKDAAKGQNDARRLHLEETAISSTCVPLIARPVVQHTCIITPKIINIRNRMYYSKKHTCFHCFYKPMTRLQTLHCAYSEENRLLKKTENSKIKTAKRNQNVKDAAKGQNDYKMYGL
jgi:23S rRNA maturation mini-RNase III